MKLNHSLELLVDAVETGPITIVSIRTTMLTDPMLIARVTGEIRAISSRSDSPNILLDFHRVERLSLDFLDAMKAVVEEIETRGGTICCCSLRREMRAVLEILGANVFYTGNSVQHAVMRYKAWLEKQNKAATKTATSGHHAVL